MNDTDSSKETETEFKARLLELIGTEKLIKWFVKAVASQVKSEFTSFTVFSPTLSILGFECQPEDTSLRSAYIPIINKYIYQSPIAQHILHNRDVITCSKNSDFTTQKTFEETELYQQAYRHIGFDYMMSAAAFDETGCLYSLDLTHSSEDFCERDRLFVQTVFPAFLKAYRINQLINRRNNAINETVKLTKKEKEVLQWVGLGKTNDEIALLENKSPRTVEKHIFNISKKMGFSRRIDLIKYASSDNYIRFPGLKDD